jgi:hypothetical protein
MSSSTAATPAIAPITRFQRSISAAVALIFTAPLVAEFLLGNLPIKMLGALVALAPAYGGAALLIREVARRTGRGWPSILMLGAAYTLIGEGFVTQSLFNPDYLKMHMHLLDHAWIPALHIGAWWTLFMFNLHTFWSMSVSIALVEALVPARAEQPWLGRIGDSVVALLFLAGCAACTAITLKGDRFVASPMQFVCAGLGCLALIVVAFLLPRRQPRIAAGATPSPWITGGVALLLGLGVLFTLPAWNWGAVAAILGIDLAFLLFVRVLSKRIAWTALHTFSLGAGGALAYGLHAFIGRSVFGAGFAARVGNAIFLAAALAVIAAGARRTARSLATTAAQPIVQ